MLASASPEALIGPIASATERIRVGSGGVMLPHYSPFKVAETFSILAALYPGRIDLGIGRASGTDPLTTYALQRDRRDAAPDDFPQQLAELLAYFEDTLPDDHPFKRLACDAARPAGAARRVAARLLARRARSGPRSSASRTRSPTSSTARAARSRRCTASASPPPANGKRPRTAVAAWVLCADSDEEAQHLAASSRMTFTLLRRGRLIPVPPPEKAIEFLRAEGKPSDGDPLGSPRDRRLAGDGSQRDRSAGRRVRRRGADRRHDHLRPRRAPALLRAARRGDGARAEARHHCSRQLDRFLSIVAGSRVHARAERRGGPLQRPVRDAVARRRLA